ECKKHEHPKPSSHSQQTLTNPQPHPLTHNQNITTLPNRPPTTLQNYHFLHKITHFHPQPIPQRLLHPRPPPPHGYFQ
ncbi:catalase, partial [Bacillus sp. WP8]|uniref:catalase n=1 Tax=Bacillus sp. WP8 TaxID=756828 RepID=UPI00119C9965